MRVLVLLLGCCLACGDGDSKSPHQPEQDGSVQTEVPEVPVDPGAIKRTRELLPRLAEPAVMDEVVGLGAVAPLMEVLKSGTAGDAGEQTFRLACIALGEIGGRQNRDSLLGRDALLAILRAPSPQPDRDGPRRLYAAAGLARMADPATAIPMIEALSKVNPNDNIASLAREERSLEYYTVDAQICEALLAMGLFAAEEDLVEQMRRRDRIRVLIDAYALLRRETGIELPYHYNGSYEDRIRQAEAWRSKLRATRADREAARAFDARNEAFVRDCRRIVAMLSGASMNDRLIAHKVLDRVGRYALPYLEEALRSDRGVAQRQAAYMMGRVGHPSAASALRKALDSDDDDARAEAIDALRLVGDSGSGAVIRPRLKDRDPEVRAAAARYLGRFGGETAKAALAEAVKTESRPAARAMMWIALLRNGDGAALDPVLAIFVSGEQIEREAAQAALEESGGRKLGSGATEPEEARRAAAAAFRQG